jgi:hypothetical protein
VLRILQQPGLAANGCLTRANLGENSKSSALVDDLRTAGSIEMPLQARERTGLRSVHCLFDRAFLGATINN